jgi:hypothetical protein
VIAAEYEREQGEFDLTPELAQTPKSKLMRAVLPLGFHQ